VLCLVTDRRAARGPLEAIVAAAVGAGVDRVQVREREMEGRELLEHVEAIARAARGADPEVELVVNRRLDVALAAGPGAPGAAGDPELGVDGVHLGFDAPPAEAARRLLGPDALLGASLHDPDELTPELAALLSYAHLAPIHDPLSKAAERPPLGLEPLRRAAAAGLPILAQGGIDASCAAACVDAGAAGVAVSGAVLGAEDPARAAAALREAVGR